MPGRNEGAPLPRRLLEFWRRRPAAGRGILLGVAVVVPAGLLIFLVVLLSLPSVTGLEELRSIQSVQLYDENDEPIPGSLRGQRIFIPLAKIPKTLRDAVIAVEDARFYSHFGVDPTGVARAIYQNLRHGRIVEGGSTITQQLARVLFLTSDRRLDRKISELVLALELEHRYSKDQILEMYLNRVYFGHGAYGVEAAAKTYFGKPVTELSLSEAALLAGIPRAPGLYSPFNYPDLALRRRTHVLNRMVETGVLKPAVAQWAETAGLRLVPPDRRTTGLYFVEFVREMLIEKYGEDMVFRGGLQVHTTLSPRLQRLAEQALLQGLKNLESRTLPVPASKRGIPSGAPEGAILTIEPGTGYIKAMVGGADFFRSEFNRAVTAKRQPGSAFKPFVYLAALEAGLTPATWIEDSPVSYKIGQNGKPWRPANYGGKYNGAITLQQGLEESVNVATVKLQEKIGIQRTIGLAHRLGIRSPLHEDLSLALGTSDLSLLELTGAYAALANQGVWISPTPIRYITDAQGKLLEMYVPQLQRAISRELAYVITHMLMGVVERGTGKTAKALGRPIAGKTGTTNDYSNAWFIGYTPSLVTGVWVGYDQPRSLGKEETGARAALPIWIRYMGKALANTPDENFPVPEGVVSVPVDLNASGTCARPVEMAFLQGTEPSNTCGDFLGVLRRLFHF